MTFEDVLAIQVSMQGISSVVGGMQSISKEIDGITRKLTLANKIGAAFVAVGVAIAGVASKAFADYRRFEIGMQSMLGDDKGSKLAKDINEMAIASSFSAEQLRQSAQMLLAMGFSADTLVDDLKTMKSLALMGGGDMQGISYALGQAKAFGVLRQAEKMQLINNGFPMAKVAEAMGMSLGQFQKQQNMPFDKLWAAIKKATAALGDNAETQRAMSDVGLQVSNTLESLQNALKSTGFWIGLFGFIITSIVQTLFGWFGWLNDLTHGLIGLVLIVWLLWRGFGLLWNFLRSAWMALLKLTTAANGAAVALEKLAIAAAANGGAGAAGAAGDAASGAAGGAAGQAAAKAGFWARLWGGVKTLGGWIWNAVKWVVTGVVGKIVLAVVVIGGLMLGIIKLVEWLGGLISGHPTPDDDKFLTGKAWQHRFRQMIHVDKSDAEERAARQTASADRGYRRSDWERMYMDRMGGRLLGF